MASCPVFLKRLCRQYFKKTLEKRNTQSYGPPIPGFDDGRAGRLVIGCKIAQNLDKFPVDNFPERMLHSLLYLLAWILWVKQDFSFLSKLGGWQ